jgi:Ca2+-binding EF-hand superfamily protein
MGARMLAVAIAFQSAVLACAQAQPRQSPPSSAEIRLGGMINSGMRLTTYLDEARRIFRLADVNADGIVSAEDLATLSVESATSLRTAIVAELLLYDSDGDGVVTRAEVVAFEMRAANRGGTAPSEEAAKKSLEAAVARRMQADLDGDGRVDFAEMLAAARPRPVPANPLERTPRMVLAMDRDGDGTTTLDEFVAGATEIFRTVDSDGDETVTKEERDGYRVRTRQAKQVAAAAVRAPNAAAVRRQQEEEEKQARERLACAMPKASDRATVVLLSAYEADALSTTTIGSQDVAVGTGAINVQSGAEPIYVVIASLRPTIWRFDGAVERIERVVLAGTAHIGATGVAAERVTFLGRPGCIKYFTDVPSTQSATAAGVVRREIGREPSVVAGQYEVSGFSVPSGDVATRHRNGKRPLVIVKESGTLRLEGDTSGIIVRKPSDDTLTSELHRFSPGGVVQIDHKTVVASTPAEPYEVLPQQAGLIQLVQSGALRQNRGREFLIQKKIRFPAELNGAHAVKFLLLRGVPEPEGDPGHSEVISEETGLPLKKAGQ